MKTFRKVLIVEDDPLLSIVEEKMVEKLGYEVVGKARCGEEILDLIQQMNPDIVLMDIQLMGQMDGIETARLLKNNNLLPPIIFLSGDDSPETKRKISDIDYIDFLIKPVSMDCLLDPLKKATSMLKTQTPYAA